MNVDGPGARPSKVVLWGMVAAILRGDEQGAKVLAADTDAPMLAAVAAESMVTLARLHAEAVDQELEETLDGVLELLTQLAEEPGDEPDISDDLRYVLVPEPEPDLPGLVINPAYRVDAPEPGGLAQAVADLLGDAGH